MTDQNPSHSSADDPRREARPWPYGQLTSAQRDAYEAINRLLYRIIRQPWTAKTDGDDRFPFLPRIDAHRSNQVLLIEGERGSGKTSLLVTLLRDWSETLRSTRGSDCELCPRGIVPVNILELSPLPDSTSMLFLFASSLRPILRQIEQGRYGEMRGPEETFDSRAPWQRSGGELTSRREWRKFARTAAMGWGRDMPQRQPQLDPEAYALELEQAEDHRLQVVADFHAFVEALARDFATFNPIGDVPPLFLVPIDDADMDPRKAIQVLEIVRVLHHPRLVFLLTGASKLFLDTLQVEVARTLVAPLRKAFGDDPVVRNAQRRALTLAQRIYQKSIPVAHQFTLQPLLPHERFEFLRDLLDQIPCFTDSRPQLATLSAYMELEPHFQRALPSWMRELVDLRARIAMILEESRPSSSATPTAGTVAPPPKHSRAVVPVVRLLWEAALEDAQIQPNLDTARDAYEAVRIGEVGRCLEVVESIVKAAANQRPVFSKTEGLRDGFVLQCRIVEDWYGTVDEQRLPARASAAFLLAATLALEGEHDVLIGRDQEWRNPGYRFAEVTFGSTSAELTFDFGWPLFDSRMTLDVVLFGRAWKTLAEQGALREFDSSEVIARRFIQIAAQVASSRATTVPDGPVPTWDTLAKQLRSLFAINGDRPPTGLKRSACIEAWIVERVGLLATPECGLEERYCTKLLDALRDAFGETWATRMVPALRRSRLQRLRSKLARMDVGRRRLQSASRVLEQIDREALDHPWGKLEDEVPRRRGRSTPPPS